MGRLIFALAALAMVGCAPQDAPDEADAAPTATGQTAADARPRTEADDMAVQQCDAAGAQFASGQPYSDALAEKARAAARATTVRRLMPGQAVTMEFRGDRLNLETDEKGVVTAVRCG